MTTTKKKLAAVVTACVVAGACVRGDPVSVAGNSEGTALLFTGAATDPSPVLPFGSASVFLNLATLSIDLTATDGFGRFGTNATFRQFGNYWSPGNSAWFFRGDAVRNASAARLDPRFPHPTSTTASFSNGNAMHLYQPNSGYPNDEYWESYVELIGLKPNTTYQIAFVHNRLKVAGVLDHAQRMLTGAVTQPDTLVLAAGTPGAINSDWSGTAPVGCSPFPGPTTNPFVFGTFTTDGAGTAAIDKCWQSGNGIWTKAEFGQMAKSMVGRNNNVTFGVPSYNYIEIWETAYGVGTGPAGRLQIAQDLAPDGTPINNALAPFPAPNTTSRLVTDQMQPSAVDRAAAYPLTGAQLLPLPASVGWPDSVTTTIGNLEAVSGAYQVWFVNPNTKQAEPASGTWVRVVGTDTVASGSGNLSFSGGPGTIRIRTDRYTAIGQPDVSDSLTTLLVSIEQGGSAAAPSSAQPFWTTILKAAGGTTGGALRFGEFTLADDTRGPEIFVAQGKLAGGVIGNVRDGTFIGSRLEVTFSGLQRPPIGYVYRAYLCESADDACSPTDPTTTFFSLGGLMSPSGLSLDAADTAPNDAFLSATRIVKAMVSVDVTGAQTLCDFDRLRLTLEPKSGAGPALAQIFSVLLPAKVRTAESCS
jgi:hypothetical protein